MRVVGLVIVLAVMLILQNMWLESTMVETPVAVKVEQVPAMHTLPLR
jgi:hypothetical protein